MKIYKLLLLGLLLIAISNISCGEVKMKKNNKETINHKHNEATKKNRLQYEKSPYLLQHANNPVDWYPWGEEAFNKAKKENKPIFLSIGYSTCHWCHVMEHESFEDAEVAKLMNDTFVSIKVDREERPAIDNIYMTVCQMMTGGGGWPLTIIMTPDKKPFFAGTYYPKESRFGRMGMLELIPKIENAWKNNYKEIIASADNISKTMQNISLTKASDTALPESLLKDAYDELSASFDAKRGGFGEAPKFPTPHRLLFLLRYSQKTGSKHALNMATETLLAMRKGGIFDQIGYGFHRYSTDTNWLVPHFEKMLYDQALLTMAFTEAYQATKNPAFAKVTEDILTYISRDMTSSEGGFFTAEDADSDGEEGKFYVWHIDELKTILSEPELKLLLSFYNAKEDGNYAVEETGKSNGTNILHLANAADLSPLSGIEKIRNKLFSVRKKRIHPMKDTKILTDWNGLMIAALAKAGKALQKQEYIDSAEKCANFILNKMVYNDNRLYHRYKDGDAAIDGKLEDYSYMILALIELYEVTFKTKYLEKALMLNDTILTHFWDEKNGGFFMTSDDSEKLISRPKESYDGAIPSGNSISMLNLACLSSFTGDNKYSTYAENIGQAFSKSITRSPSNHSMMMCALLFATYPPYEIVISANQKSDATTMINAIDKIYFPNKVVIFREGKRGATAPPICKIAKFAKSQEPVNDTATAYICIDFACNKPTISVKEVVETIQNKM